MHYPYWNEPNILARENIGNCYTMVADSILTLEPPFPGDELYFAENIRPELRFHVLQRPRAPFDFVIEDRLTDTKSIISQHRLKDPNFDISYWYAEQWNKELRLTGEITHHREMGDAISIVATKLLTDGIASSFPSTSYQLAPGHRFRIYRSDRGNRLEEYIIEDADLGENTNVPKTWLEDPTFDLVGWYRLYLGRRGFFEHQYHEKQSRTYRKEEVVIPSNGKGPDSTNQPDLPPSLSAGEPTANPADWDKLPEFEVLTADGSDFESEEFFEEENLNQGSDLEDLPGLDPLSDDSDDEVAADDCHIYVSEEEEEKILVERIKTVLTQCQPFPGDGPPIDISYKEGDQRFAIELRARGLYCVYDRVQGFEADIHVARLRWEFFSIGKWYAERCAANAQLDEPWICAHQWLLTREWEDTVMGLTSDSQSQFNGPITQETAEGKVELGGIQVDKHKYPALQRNSAQVKGNQRILPKPIVVKVTVNGHPARALLDSGSLGDFMSSTLADQLGVERKILDSPLALQLAVQGSRSKVNSAATVQIVYQGINETRTFDIINLNSYDMILGTPWMHQHQTCIGFNPARIVIGSNDSQPLRVGHDTKLMTHALTPEDQYIEKAREELRRCADPLCKEVAETDLPPLRAINHTIPLINEKTTYSWRPSRCPEAFRAQWAEKRDAYIKSGRWKITSAGNTVPMLLIPKPGTNPPQLRTVVDLRERNKNTHKATSPLPDMEGMLRRTASKPFRTALDLKNAYEQIRIVPEHVSRSAVTTLDGNMVSQVAQQGDCNAPATYQALMNHLFSSYIGRFMDIYLDDIVIYSDTLEDHVKHVKLVLDILQREKLYLSRSKLRFIVPELKLLGRIVDDKGIKMDADKVDSVMKWKVPTNRDLLRGFIGSVGYLADDIPNIRIPMGVLSSITGDTVPFRWGYTEQRAFDEVKALVHSAREHHRVPIDYSEGAPTVWMITDGCSTGISGLISQGRDWKTAKIAAFYSAKLNAAQQNYPVHEIEMLAGIETMLRHHDVLQGAKFKWLTDHKGLIYLLNQKNLSGRQARWLEKISSFSFEVVYIPGSDNIVADALSRIYSNDSSGTVRARSEYTYHDVVDDDTVSVENLPVLAGIEARVATRRGSRDRRPSEKKAVMTAQTEERTSPKASASRRKSRSVLENTRTPAETTEGGSTGITDREDTDETENTVVEHINTGSNGSKEGSLINIVSQSLHGLDLLAELRGKYGLDPTFQGILAKPNEFRNFEVEEHLVYLKKSEKKLLCIPKIEIQGRSAREIVISEAHSMLAHLGASKTLDYIRDHVWWKDMVSDVRAFCETCHTCKISKPSNQKPYGLLNPLSVPSYPWESIGMDFVGPLPESGNRDGMFDSIKVVICLLTSMVHLIPSRTNYNASQLAELMFEHVYKLHGLPKNIISDRDVLFTSTFWRQLHRLIGTNL